MEESRWALYEDALSPAPASLAAESHLVALNQTWGWSLRVGSPSAEHMRQCSQKSGLLMDQLSEYHDGRWDGSSPSQALGRNNAPRCDDVQTKARVLAGKGTIIAHGDAKSMTLNGRSATRQRLICRWTRRVRGTMRSGMRRWVQGFVPEGVAAR